MGKYLFHDLIGLNQSPYVKSESDCFYKDLQIKDLRNLYTKTIKELQQY